MFLPQLRSRSHVMAHRVLKNLNKAPIWGICTRAFIAAPLVATLVMGQTHAQQTSADFDPDAVVFSVNGKDYTNRDLATASIDYQRELERIRPQERRDALIEIMINMLVLADEAKKEKLDKSEEFDRRVEQLKARALRNFYIRKIIHPQITEKMAQDRYVELLARFEPQTQLRARHILLASEDEAKAVIKDLDSGKDFIELAKTRSTGPSAPSGGDLGYFGADQMVAPFQEAAAKLKTGEYTKTPVKTQFGWHVIRLEDSRKEPAPTYEEALPEIQDQLFNEIFQKKVDELRKQSKINIVKLPLPTPEATGAAPTTNDSKDKKKP